MPLALGLAAYGVVTEVLQAVLPIERDGSLLDLGADVGGIVIGLGLSRMATRLGVGMRGRA